MALLVCSLVFFPGLETFDHLKLIYDRVGGGGELEQKLFKNSNAGGAENVEASI